VNPVAVIFVVPLDRNVAATMDAALKAIYAAKQPAADAARKAQPAAEQNAAP
jgi:hypothetical protein